MDRVLFICTHNSARSQMAEGLTNHYFKDWEAFSAGTVKTQVKSQAISVLKDINIDISHHTSKKIDVFLSESFELVVTVCDSAKETCPFFPNAKNIVHAGFQDPSDVIGTEEDKLKAFTNSRDKILKWLRINLPNYSTH